MITKEAIIKNDKGFTLIEILVAITILSLLMVSVYTILDESSRTKDTVLKEDRRYLQVHSALDRFALDWSQLYTPLYHSSPYKGPSSENNDSFDRENAPKNNSKNQDFAPKNNTVRVIKYEPSDLYPLITEKEQLIPIIDDPNRGELIFMSTSGRRVFENSKQSRYQWIRYSLRSSTAEDDEIDKEAPLELTRSSIKTNIYRKEFEWENIPKYVILRHIKSLTFLFWNSETERYVTSLKELNNEKDSPRIIKIKLVINNFDNIEETIERSYKPIWPYFDIKAAQKEKKSKKNTRNK